jgi:hypothetical protein
MSVETIITKLDKLKDIVQKKDVENMKEEYEKYKDLYDIVKQFTIDNKLPLYGGAAINELLPEKNKIYSEFEIPDYDFFSPFPKQHAIQLAHILDKKGYKYIEVKGGMHSGTFKVFAEFKPVADITKVKNSYYKYLIQNSIKTEVTKVYTVPVDFLKLSFYKELSRPEGSLSRWEKVYKRYRTFLKYHKSNTIINNTPPVIVTPLDKKIREFIKEKQLPVIGIFGIELLLNESVSNSKLASYEVLSTDILKTQKEFEKYLNMDLTIKTKEVMTDIMQDRIKIYHNDTLLLTIYDIVGNCYATNKINGYKVGSYDTIMLFLYVYNIKNIIDLLENKYIKYDINNRISTECYGKELSLLDIKKEKWHNKNFVYRI